MNNELADADSIDLTTTARFIKEAESVFVQMPSESLRVKHIHGVTLEVKALANAYLARESDDAKPVDRDWLDDSVGGRIENAYLRPHGDGQGRCDAIQEIGGEWWAYLACMESAGSAAARRLDTRGDVRAFLRLADWPTNENGGA